MLIFFQTNSISAYASNLQGYPVFLKNCLNRLDSFTSAVRLTRPVGAVTLAGSILDDLPRVEEEVARFTPALQPVIGQIVGLSRFKSTDPFSPTGPDRDFISKQRALIDFQEEQGLFMQAISLAREWMVTVLLVSAGDGAKWLESEIRNESALTFGGAEYKIRNNPYQRSRYSDWFESLPAWRECTSIWMETSRLRNSIDHCGMDPGSVKQRSKNLEKNVHKALRKMKYFESLMLDKLSKK